MKTVFSFLAIILSLISPLFAQAPAIEWQKTIGGEAGDNLISLKQAKDGGYILGGSSDSDISGDKSENHMGVLDFWMVKVDSIGAVQWENTIGGSGFDRFWSLQLTDDEGFILIGDSNSNISGDKTENCIGSGDYWVMKLNAEGVIQWQNTIGGDNYELAFSGQQTSDGGYIIGGYSDSDLSGDKTENSFGDTDYWVLKLNASGEIQWQKTIGGSDSDYFRSLQQTTDGGYILGGFSMSNASGLKTENCLGGVDYWVVKLSANGDIQWQNTIGGNKNDYLQLITQTTDGGFFLGGQSNSNISGDKTENSKGGADYWVVKLNGTGEIQWENTIGGNKEDVLPASLQQTTDGGYIIGGYSASGISGDKTEGNLGDFDYWVVKLNPTGQIQWQNTIGGNSSDELRSLQQTADGGYILGGYSLSNISGDKTENSNGYYDYWIIKLAPETVPTTEVPTTPSSLTLYPNPTTDAIFVQSEAATTLCLYNAFGQILSTQTIQGESKIDLSSYPNGIYFLVEMETGIGHKILKSK